MSKYEGSLKEHIHGEEWDVLIVLDACRFDYFERYIRDIPLINDGELKPLRSEGLATPQTLINVFDGFYDWDVISGHPWINSIDHEIREDETEDGFGSYNSSEHFDNIDDAWRLSERDWAIKPNQLTDHASGMGTFDRKTMVWYLDPHKPYEGSITVDFPVGNRTRSEVYTTRNGVVLPGAQRLFRAAYTSNLIKVLYHVSRLIGHLDNKKVVITSDHGEKLFHGGDTIEWLGHDVKNDTWHLRQVPWYEVDSSDVPQNLTDEEYIYEAFKTILDREPGPSGYAYTEWLEKPQFDRFNLIEELMLSEEYRDRIGEPDGPIRRDDDEVEARLRALGYLD